MGKFTDRNYTSGYLVLGTTQILRMVAKEYRVSFCGYKSVLKFIVLMFANFYEYAKNHRIVHFIKVNCHSI